MTWSEFRFIVDHLFPQGAANPGIPGGGSDLSSKGYDLRRRLPVALAVVLISCCLVGSCSRGDPDSGAVKVESRELRKDYAKGPVRVCLLVDREAMTVAENLQLTIEIEAPEEVAVEFPALSKELGGFSIVDEREDLPQLLKLGVMRYRKVYTLEPFLAGAYTIPPLPVGFYEKATGGEGRHFQDKGQLNMEAVTIEVRSVLAEKGSESPLNPIFGPVDLPHDPLRLLYAFLGAVLILACTGAILWWVRWQRGRKAPRESVLPAHEIAYLELQRLLDEKLPERGLFKLFYGKVSDVLRRYLENRFALQASTLTTQEFLEKITRSSPFPPEQQSLLDAFLGHCDLVKFAELQPTAENLRETVDACRAFIEATREEKVAPAQNPPQLPFTKDGRS